MTTKSQFLWIASILLTMLVTTQHTSAFATSRPSGRHVGSTTTLTRANAKNNINNGFSSSAPKAAKTPSADFEYQELKIQLNAMKEQNLVTSQIGALKRLELQSYAEKIATQRQSDDMATLQEKIPYTTWRLAFSTQSLTEGLPKDAAIQLKFTSMEKMDYILKFTKTFGLKRLTAQSSYSVNPAGYLTYVYENITTDVFGFQNMGVGMFGMLQGRSSTIPTVFFDGSVWIERGADMASGKDYWNVYLKESENDN